MYGPQNTGTAKPNFHLQTQFPTTVTNPHYTVEIAEGGSYLRHHTVIIIMIIIISNFYNTGA